MKISTGIRRACIGGLGLAVTGLTVVATSPAQAAVSGTTSYVCATPLGDQTVPVTVTAQELPASVPAGYPAPAGAFPVDVDITIPASLGNTLLFFGKTAVGGSSDNFALGVGSASMPLSGLSTAPVTVVADQPTVLNADTLSGAFTTPAAGTVNVTTPASFVYRVVDQDNAAVAQLTCARASDAVPSLGSVVLTKQASKTTAKPVASPVKATKKAKIKVAVTRSVGGIPTGKVVAKIGKKVVGTGVLAAGKAQLTLAKLKPGTYKVAISYAGDGSTKPSTAKATVKVVK